jgi:hypothetical protein
VIRAAKRKALGLQQRIGDTERIDKEGRIPTACFDAVVENVVIKAAHRFCASSGERN